MFKRTPAAVLLLLTSCVSYSSYSPPTAGIRPDDFAVVVDGPFDDVWEYLIDYAGSTFFGIENFEKESGLITLSFGSGTPSEYVTGGHWENYAFEGDYVDYLARHFNGRLTGKMNLVVRHLDEGRTKVTVNASYVFVASGMAAQFSTASGTGCVDVLPTKRGFGTAKYRTLCSTYVAENAVLSHLRGYATRESV